MTNKALKDWSTIISALGNAKQTILIRRPAFRVSYNEFLLYPTYGHSKDKIKEEYHPLFEESMSSRPSQGVRIEYLARCEKIMVTSDRRKLRELSSYYAWTKEHVEEYFEDTAEGKLCILILRVYSLPEPRIVQPSRAMTWVTLPYSISLQDCTPVLRDQEFNRIELEIRTLLEETPLPKLEVSCPQKVNLGERITFRVTANRIPVEKARLLVANNLIGVTDRSGKATHTFTEVGSHTITAIREGYASISVSVEVQSAEYERTHERMTVTLKEIGEMLNFMAKKEERSPDRIYRYDGTWRDSEGHVPIKVFEVELSHNIDLALLRLSHANDIGWKNPCLVLLDERDKDRIKKLLEPRLTGAFSKIARILKIYTADEIDDLHRSLTHHRSLIRELGTRE